MIDLADHLVVTGPGGAEIQVRVDDVLADPKVMAAIEWRVEGGDLTPIPPGGTLVYRLPEFNRGWARYPLLEKGKYTIRFEIGRAHV